jgi:hypothetical protein
MPSRLCEEVVKDPPEVHHRLCANVATVLVKQCGPCDRVHFTPSSTILTNNGIDRIVVFDRVPWQIDLRPSGETPTYPEKLCLGQVFYDPQQARPTRNERSARVVFSQAIELADNRVTLILHQRKKRRALSFTSKSRWLLICHTRTVAATQNWRPAHQRQNRR